MPSNPTPTCADWYQALTQWKELKKSNPGLKKTEFLASDASGSRLRNCKTHANQFSINLKKFEAGTLENTRARRQRNRKFLAIEDKLIKYIDARAMKYARDKCGISWNRLKVKCQQWAHNLGIEEDQFRASDGWINNCLKRNNRAEQEQVDENDDDKDEEDDEETEDDEPVKVRKTEALKAIDLLKRYCREQEMGPDLHGQIQRVENQMMNHRFEKSTAQRSLISYFGTSS